MRQEYSALVEAGVHAQVAAVICGVIGDGSSFCVTWALVLARLLSMAGPARRRVAQAFGDFDECVLIASCCHMYPCCLSTAGFL